MKLLLLFVALFQVNQSVYDDALSLSTEGEFIKAIELIESEIPNGIPDSLYDRTVYLLAWNYKQIDQRESVKKSVNLLSELIESRGLSESTLAARIYSLRANGYYQLGNIEEYFQGHLKALSIAESIGDSAESIRALRNLYTYYSGELSSKEIAKEIVDKINSYKSFSNELLFQAKMIEAWYESKYGDVQRAVELVAQAKLTGRELGLDRYQEALFAAVRFYIKDENFILAERTIYELLNDPLVQNSPEMEYIALARLAHLYSLVDRRDEAQPLFDRMDEIEEHVGAYEIRLGVVAEMAFNGIEDSHELDPVFEEYKKSGLDWWAKMLFLAAGFGLLAALLFTGRFYLNPAPVSHPKFSGAWSQYAEEY